MTIDTCHDIPAMPDDFRPALIITAKDGTNELGFAITEQYQKDHSCGIGSHIEDQIRKLRHFMWLARFINENKP